jgi:regulatory protein
MPKHILGKNSLEEGFSEAKIAPTDVRVAAMNLLARREHSISELRRKLKRRFPDDAVIDEQIARLTGENLQSNRRFAESYARQRIDRGYGPVRVCEELRERGASSFDVTAAIEESQVDWFAVASEVALKKFGALPPSDIKEKARRARFMQYRGFTIEHYEKFL